MKELRATYFSIRMTLFPVPEDEKIEISGKIKEFRELIEVVKPARFLNGLLFWTGLGRPMKDREAIIRALTLKHVYNLPTTKLLIETLKNSFSLYSSLNKRENFHKYCLHFLFFDVIFTFVI